MKIKLYDTNHFNYATEDGRVFCRKHHKIFRLCDRRHHIDCLQCSYFFGCLQGEGVECRWDDVGNFGLYRVHDPEDEFRRVSMLVKKGIIKKEQIEALKEGVTIDDNITVAAKRVKLKKYDPKTNTCMVQITICEGKNHQVKKMFAAVGFDVIKLKREKEGFFDLKNLQSGEFRKLTPKEVKRVYGLEEDK